MRTVTTICAATLILTTIGSQALAESARTGLEISLAEGPPPYLGRPHRIRGVAWEVRGLVRLVPLTGARVRARISGGDWAEARSGAAGAFEVTVDVPAQLELDVDEGPQIEIEVIDGQHRRSYEHAVTVHSPLRLLARTDRRLYEPGETVHFWARVVDARTHRPLSDIPVQFDFGQGEVTIATSAAGVASTSYQTEDEENVITYASGSIRAGRDEQQVSTSVAYRIGQRPTTDLFVTLETTPTTAGPGRPVTATVRVRTPSGFPARNAHVRLNASSQTVSATTDIAGEATVELRAPQYNPGQSGRVTITGNVRHPGYGTSDFSGSFAVRAPSALTIEALSPRGGLVPEVDDRLILSVVGASRRPSEGTRVEVHGAAIAGGRARVTTDQHGFAALPIRLGTGGFAHHRGSSGCRGPATTIDVEVLGDAPQQTRICLTVLDQAQVLPRVATPAVGPGDPIEVTLHRRPEVARRPLVVELLAREGSELELIRSTVVTAGSSRTRFDAPEDRLGFFYVRARPLLDQDERETTEGVGALEPLLVRPDRPAFPELELDREQYPIRGRAQLTVRGTPNPPQSHMAILIRDLAQHQGEVPFTEYFLRRALRRAVLSPDTPAAERLIRAALADHDQLDGEGQAMARDAVARSADLVVTAGEWMVAVERLLTQALAGETVSQITEGSGARRRFVANVVDLAVGLTPRTLGEGEVTVEMLIDLDSSFTFETVARRVARKRLVRLMSLLARYLDPEQNTVARPRGRSSEPPERWLSELVRQGVITPSDLHDPWGGTYVIQRTGRTPRFTLAVEAEGFELLSPGPDGRPGTADDVADPLARVVPEGTLYATASGEDRLMNQLSALSPGSVALDNLLVAYDRLNDEALEELIGDTVGHGGGGGSGSGYGRGAGRLRGRRASVPSIRAGSATVGGMLAGIVRQEFPATLLFVPEAQLDPSGTSTIEIPLAEAPTTYIVEVILWRDDGWVWSANTRLRVDQDLIVDAPVPTRATVGDELSLPLRVANRTTSPRTVRVRVSASEGLGLEPIEAGPVEVPAGDAVEVPVTLTLTQEAEGHLTVAALEPGGDPIDAVRRPMTVQRAARRAHGEAEAVLLGNGSVTLAVPEGAVPRGTNQVDLLVGAAIFRHPNELETWPRWIQTMIGPGEPMDVEPVVGELDALLEGSRPLLLGHNISAAWLVSSITDAPLERAIEVLTDHVEGVEVQGAREVRQLARVLMMLAPASLHRDARPNLERPLRQLLRQLRRKVQSESALTVDAPWLSARVAAALLWTSDDTDHPRAMEMLDRAREGAVDVADDRWVEGGTGDVSRDELFAATSALALAELRIGRRDEAFRLIRAMARLIRSSGGTPEEVRRLEIEDRSLAGAAAELLATGPLPSPLAIDVDGTSHSVELEQHSGTVEIEALGQGGEHTVELTDAAGALAVLRASSEYTVDWSAPPPHPGPLALTIEGETGNVDHRSELRLVVRNRIPRLLMVPVIEINLPAGVEIDESARTQITRTTTSSPDISAGTLRITLRPLCPRQEVTVRLPWLWTTAGELTGLGVTGWTAERPEAITVLPARRLQIDRDAATAGGAR